MHQFYFNQTKEWTSFWKEANDDNHKVIEIKTTKLHTFIYEYPFVAGKKFWYIPRGFNLLKDNTNKSEVERFVKKIVEQAKKSKISYIKLELAEEFLEVAGLAGSEVTEILQNWGLKNTKKSEKKLQYLSTKQINLEGIVIKKSRSQKLKMEQVAEFVETNQDWINQNMDKRTRYGNRKALKSEWQIDVSESRQTFEDFYELHRETGERQGFGVHAREYLHKLFEQDFSRLIVLRDAQGKAQSGWFGVSLNGVLVNLYGGNGLYSRDNYGQYLMHLVAMMRAKSEKCAFYDLGGLEEGKGFDLFKKGYQGEIINFTTPVDIVLDKWSYRVYNLVRRLRNRK